jgi:cellulose synthase/poly-beta-1,6-N-acetylglucosamine synthase-like glycosyltransferase
MIFFYFLTIITALYFILHIIYLFGYIKSSSLKQNDSPLPRVSIIVAARNEENIISGCIDSLKRLNYNSEFLEVILVNDNSTDRTKEIMLSESEGLNNFKVIESEKSSKGNLIGKPNAIDTAIRICSGEIIFMTDADCIIPENWILEMVKYYDSNTQMVCGFTKIRYEHSFFAKIQSLDWIYLQTLAMCSAGIGKILSCIGNNLSFTKSVYNNIGGYSKINFSVTEDLALMRTIDSMKSDNIKYPVNTGCVIITDECKNLRELYNQKKRWFKGGFDINFLGWIMGFELYIINIILVFGYLFLDIRFYLLFVFIKIFSELLIVLPVYKKLKYKNLIIYFPFYQIYFAIYGLLLPFTFIFGKSINWKGRKL